MLDPGQSTVRHYLCMNIYIYICLFLSIFFSFYFYLSLSLPRLHTQMGQMPMNT